MLSEARWQWRRAKAQWERLRGSLVQRGWSGTLHRLVREFRPLRRQEASPRLISLDQSFAPFELPTSLQPEVSVIIPVHGKRPYTVACLRSIAARASEIPFEVVVVDDASPDDTAAVLAQIQGLRLHILERNQGFVGACNIGAQQARGRFLLFLNNDTQVMPGWMEALRRSFDDVPDCGIVGSRLLYPDGRLQECGGLVFADGSAWNCGRFDDPHDPRWLYRRQCDYVSGAALMVPTELFRKLGGFDPRYAPAYYEDTDLAFAVRAAGYKVLVQPASTVIHYEGATAGRDLHTGVKRYQIVNRAAFAAKWCEMLQCHPPSDSSVAVAVDRAQRRERRLLVIESTLPDARRDSGSVRLIEILRLAGALGWAVTLLADDGRFDPVLAARLGDAGIEVAVARSARAWLRAQGGQFAAVILSRYAVAKVWLGAVRSSAPQAKLVFDTVDLHHLRESRAASAAGLNAATVDATRVGELAVIAQADITLLTSSVERDLVRSVLPEAQLALLGNVHVVRGRSTGFDGRRDLLFIGGFDHPPNVDAVRWFLATIWPSLRTRNPDMQLHLVGSADAARRAEFAVEGVHVHGRVERLEPWLDRCRVSIAPLRFGAGVKGKINSAMASGLPVVATTIAAEAMQLEDGRDVLIADSPDAFRDAVERVYGDASLWQRLSDNAMANVAKHFSPQLALQALRSVLSK